MKILVISDIHANLTALEAVLEDVEKFDCVWFLGDLVGYGPDPNECVERLRGLPCPVTLMGNHDAAAIDKIETMTFNHEARQALEWTRSVLKPKNEKFLRQLSEREQVDDVTLVHGSPRDPTMEYLLDSYTVTENFDHFDTPICMVGHTHLPVIYQMDNSHLLAERKIPQPDQEVIIRPRVIVNPGSVGQPRDRNPQAAYAIFNPDTNAVQFKRVAYDIKSVQERMKEFNLPRRHINRLDLGW